MRRIRNSSAFYFIVAIELAVACLADSGSVHADDSAHRCVMNFPMNDTLGVLMLARAGGHYPNWEKHVPATGPIEIPAGFVAGLEIRDEVANALHLLQNLDVSRLVHLSISGSVNSDSDIKLVEGLKNLRSVDVSVSGITDNALAHVARLPVLTGLYLQGCNKIDGSGLSYFHSGSSLKTLRIEVGSGRGIRYMPRIESLATLVCSGTLDSLLLQQLETQTQLDTLDLERTRLTSADAARLHEALPGTVIKCFYTMDEDTELLDHFEDAWRTLLLNKYGLTEDYFERHVSVVSRRIHKWAEGSSFEIAFETQIDWVRISSTDKFLVRKSDRDAYYDYQMIEWNLVPAYSQINLTKPVGHLRYRNEDEALEEAERLSGRENIQVEALTFRVGGKLPRQDGDPYLMFSGSIPEREHWCVKGWLNLVTGVGESREVYCGPVE